MFEIPNLRLWHVITIRMRKRMLNTTNYINSEIANTSNLLINYLDNQGSRKVKTPKTRKRLKSFLSEDISLELSFYFWVDLTVASICKCPFFSVFLPSLSSFSNIYKVDWWIVFANANVTNLWMLDLKLILLFLFCVMDMLFVQYQNSVAEIQLGLNMQKRLC